MAGIEWKRQYRVAQMSPQMQRQSHSHSVGTGGDRVGDYPSLALVHQILQAVQHFSDETFQMNTGFASNVGKLLIATGP